MFHYNVFVVKTNVISFCRLFVSNRTTSLKHRFPVQHWSGHPLLFTVCLISFFHPWSVEASLKTNYLDSSFDAEAIDSARLNKTLLKLTWRNILSSSHLSQIFGEKILQPLTVHGSIWIYLSSQRSLLA